MKVMKKLLAATVALCAISSVALAKPCELESKTESYAHPTLFKSQAQTLVDAKSVYVTGGKILKSKNKITVGNKDNVYVKSWAKDVLDIIKDSQLKSGYTTSFNPKAPTLRSEVATILAEGLNVKTPESFKPYTDINDAYWAKDWIYKVTEKEIMIGYPSGVFKPDQPITKAEVFATVAKLINIDHSATKVPEYKGQKMQYIPTWAYSATNEVIASNLLDAVPNTKQVIDSEYLSKEQVAYLVASLRKNLSSLQSGKAISNGIADSCGITTVKVKLLDRLSAKTSNIGEWFTAKTTEEVVVNGTTFPAGSIVRGEVIAVQRPGIEEPGYIKVQFKYIKNGDLKECLPKQVASASVEDLKNPNILARLLGAPLSIAGRAVGVVGRSGGAIVNVAGNGLEEVGDELSNTLVETFTLHPGRGAASLGNSVVTVFKGVFDITKICLSGVFGVIYEVGDELVYVLVPSLSNSSSLNPNEELTIVF